MKIVTVNQMQKAEQDCAIFGISVKTLMENAGRAVATETARILGGVRGKHILILVGPGNNGGDGLVAARHLHDAGAGVTVYLGASRPPDDANLSQVIERGIPCLKGSEDADLNQLGGQLCGCAAVLDAFFGTGKSRGLQGLFAGALQKVGEHRQRQPRLKLIAVDLPSGMNADTGSVDPTTPTADNTITLGFPKTGLFNLPASGKAGLISVVDIGIPAGLVDYVNLEFLTADMVRPLLPPRPIVSHKGTYGKVLAYTGSLNYIGAAYLACSASIRVGAGLTTLTLAESLLPILAGKLNEVTYLPLPETTPGLISLEAAALLRRNLPEYNVFLAGCGLGQSQAVRDLIDVLLFNPRAKMPPAVLDADALNLLASFPKWWQSFSGQAVLTPHAGEMARLINQTPEDIQTNRTAIAREAAQLWDKILVLKGAYTVIASPDGRTAVSPFATSVLASAGTGDILAGAIAGLAAQGLALYEAALCGVYLHGAAAKLVEAELGDSGALASDLLPALPRAIRQLKAD